MIHTRQQVSTDFEEMLDVGARQETRQQEKALTSVKSWLDIVSILITSFLFKFNISRAKFVIFFPMQYFSGTLCVPME
jgi:hypothetical protein